jgi:hypothetical protein
MNTTNLASYVRNNFDGILVVGDTHAEFESISCAFKYAVDNDYFFVSLGDLVDRGPKPFETVDAMLGWMITGQAGFVIGNHDDKFRRFFKGSKVSFSLEAKRTLAQVGPERQDEFLKAYTNIVEMPTFSAMFHTFDDITLVHAASHPCIWDKTERFGDSARSRMLFGETNGEVYDDGYPVRLYNWIDEIPVGKTVVVGHDRMAVYNLPLTEPLIKSNNNGGRTIFMDTGCGKGGFMSGVVITCGKKFKIERFVEFK